MSAPWQCSCASTWRAWTGTCWQGPTAWAGATPASRSSWARALWWLWPGSPAPRCCSTTRSPSPCCRCRTRRPQRRSWGSCRGAAPRRQVPSLVRTARFGEQGLPGTRRRPPVPRRARPQRRRLAESFELRTPSRSWASPRAARRGPRRRDRRTSAWPCECTPTRSGTAARRPRRRPSSAWRRPLGQWRPWRNKTGTPAGNSTASCAAIPSR
mmetsp:Transcript_3178/g.9799  ORF Transcript_3178/g.9799 Transcript_3178/m.9799 type:complete len:212 (-) Transcript_3178:111-746(-)